jgi:hypothetical protein
MVGPSELVSTSDRSGQWQRKTMMHTAKLNPIGLVRFIAGADGAAFSLVMSAGACPA